MQNSRGFRALKVWLALRQVGREGYVQMIGDDIRLSNALHDAVVSAPELEPVTQDLSITTFRFVPSTLAGDSSSTQEYLLRACIVNFRTSLADVQALPGIVTRLGRQVDLEMRAPPVQS